MAHKDGILIITPFFRPNIGGVETHLNDLCAILTASGYHVYVITYQPITTNEKAPSVEIDGKLEVRRIRWPGFNLFHELERFPFLEFLYITPRLLIAVFLFLAFNKKRIGVIHAHGFNAAFIGGIIKPFFRKRVVVSTHAIYNLGNKGIFQKILRWTLGKADSILCVSRPSLNELAGIGVSKNKLKVYTYWVDQKAFRPLDRESSKKQLGWPDKFVVLFVGRFIEKKGMRVLLEAAQKAAAGIFIAFIGDGPLAREIEAASKKRPNVIFIGKVENAGLPVYYNAADILCAPSLYEEAFGRVVAEALSCELPVVVSKRGGMAEIVDEAIGIKVEPVTPEALADTFNQLYRDKERLGILRQNSRRYAMDKFGERNAGLIIESYNN